MLSYQYNNYFFASSIAYCEPMIYESFLYSQFCAQNRTSLSRFADEHVF